MVEGHYVYVIYANSFDKIYIGYSSDPEKRLISHNADFNHGWTRRYRPWSLVYTEKLPTKKIALQRERQLKSARGRRFIREEIIKQLPD